MQLRHNIGILTSRLRDSWVQIPASILVFSIIPLTLLSFLIAGTAGAFVAGIVLPSLSIIRLSSATPRILANGDGATGLPTPSQMEALIADWPDQVRRDFKKTACFIIEVDHFSGFVQQHGETASFQLTRSLATRLREVLREDDVITRLGDGTFKCMIKPVQKLDLEICIQLANRIKSAMESPLMIDNSDVSISVSIGFCISGQMSTQAMQALEEGATIALSAAQKANHSSIRAFSPKLLQRHQNKRAIDEAARDALANKEVVAWFQPQISTETGAISGFEALARWDHPSHGIMPPGNFLNAIAESGQLEKLFEEMLAQSLRALNEWDMRDLHVPHVGINFSGDELHNPMLAERLRKELDKYDVAPNRVSIEVLENVIAGAPDGIVSRNLRDLSSMGCQIDLDDFGTGHASISSIQKFSANRLKIDRSFVTRVDRDPSQQKLIAAIVTMADQLGISTLAEGVESAAEHAMLSQLGCRHAQGFGIGRPMPFSETIPWMKSHLAKLQNLPRVGKKTR